MYYELLAAFPKGMDTLLISFIYLQKHFISLLFLLKILKYQYDIGVK